MNPRSSDETTSTYHTLDDLKKLFDDNSDPLVA